MRYFQIFILLFLLLYGADGIAQGILKGSIVDETQMGVPMADVFVKNRPELRTRADIDGNYLMRLQEGEYYMVFSASGYEQREIFVVVKEGETVKNVQLYPIDVNELDEFDYAVKRTNPGRDIIKKVVEIKDQLDFNKYPYKCNVYIRAKDNKESKEDPDEEDDEKTVRDTEDLKRKKLGDLNNMNMVEVEMVRNYEPPNNVREIRNAYSKRGDDSWLYHTTTTKSNINFFKNMLYLDDLNESPIQSPISTAGILSYKYRLVEKIERDGQPTLNKIKIEPRSVVTSTLQGHIWVQDSTWMVEKLDLKLVKGNLFVYDYFQVIQDFDVSSDTLCLLKSQEMNYGADYRKANFEGKTIVNYSDYEFYPDFPKNYFGNEVAVTTEEAYDRDTSYWSENRKSTLSKEEYQYIKKRDSIENLFSQKSYLDSVDSVFNRVTFWKVVWFGIDHRNRAKKTQWTISSLAGMLQPAFIAGPRVGQNFDFFKKWDNEKTIDSYTRVDVGVLNGDIKGRQRIAHLYDPFKLGTAGIDFEHNYDLIRTFDAFSQVFLRENFIEKTSGSIFNDIELFNGLYLENNLELTERRPLPEGTKFIRWFDDALDNNEPPEFERYKAVLFDMTLSYIPFQKYMREPNRKVVLGSKWPEFYVYYEKGIPKFLGSEINHDYIRFGIRQSFKISTFGTSSYHTTTGKFLNSKDLREVDFKYHRRSDQLWFSNPLYSFQDLDTSLPTLDWYYEAHFIHHFNGALINKIPFMKKTRITSVAGAGYLWVPEHNWQHYEFFAGLERIFKITKRRIRLGLYVTFSDGNQSDPRNSFKISFSVLDRRDMKFNF